jgi:hypothetical protein
MSVSICSIAVALFAKEEQNHFWTKLGMDTRHIVLRKREDGGKRIAHADKIKVSASRLVISLRGSYTEIL